MDEIDPVAASITPEQKTAIGSSSGTYDPTAPADPVARTVHTSPQQFAEETIRNGLMVNRPWDETAKMLQERGLNPKPVEGHYKLQMAHQARAKEEDESSWQGDTLRQFARTSIPGYSGIQGFRDQKHYAEAMARLKAGTATDDDYKEIAHAESIQAGNKRGEEYLKNRFGENTGKFLGGAIHVLGSAPAMLGEAAVGGGIAGRIVGQAPVGSSLLRQAGQFALRQAVSTPLMPSLYAEQWAANNIKHGRDPMNLQGLGTAGLQAFTQNLVLGTMQSKMGENYSTAARVLMKGATGVGESALGDLALSGLDYLLPKGMETGVKGGVIGKLARGEFGAAGQEAAGQMFAFTLFAGLHELQSKPGGEEPTKIDLKDALKDWYDHSEALWDAKRAEAERKGYSPPLAAEMASKMTAGIMTRITDSLKDDPTKEVFLSRFGEADLADPHAGPLIKKFADSIKAKAEAAPAPEEPAAPDLSKLPPRERVNALEQMRNEQLATLQKAQGDLKVMADTLTLKKGTPEGDKIESAIKLRQKVIRATQKEHKALLDKLDAARTEAMLTEAAAAKAAPKPETTPPAAPAPEKPPESPVATPAASVAPESPKPEIVHPGASGSEIPASPAPKPTPEAVKGVSPAEQLAVDVRRKHLEAAGYPPAEELAIAHRELEIRRRAAAGEKIDIGLSKPAEPAPAGSTHHGDGLIGGKPAKAPPPAPPPPRKLGGNPVEEARARAAAAGRHAKITEQVRSTEEMIHDESDAKDHGAKEHEVAEGASDGVRDGTPVGEKQGVLGAHAVISQVEARSPGVPQQAVPQAADHPEAPAGSRPGRRGAEPIGESTASSEDWKYLLNDPGFDFNVWRNSPLEVQNMILAAVPEFAAILKRNPKVSEALSEYRNRKVGGSKKKEALNLEDADKDIAQLIKERQAVLDERDDLTDRDKVALKERVAGASLRVAGDAAGVSHAHVANLEDRVFGDEAADTVEYQKAVRKEAEARRIEETEGKPRSLKHDETPEEVSHDDWLLSQDVKPGDPIPGVTKGAHASTPEELSQIEGAIGKGGRVGMGAAPAGFGKGAVEGPGAGGRIAAGVAAAWRGFVANIKQLAGQIAPRISRLWPELGNRVARFGASGEHTRRATDYWQEQILGPLEAEAQKSPEFAKSDGTPLDEYQTAVAVDTLGRRYMSVMHEERFRLTRAAYQEAAMKADMDVASAKTEPAKEKARKEAAAARKGAREVKSFVGEHDTGIRDEAHFKEIQDSEGYKAYRERWKPFSDKADELFKQVLGPERADMVDSVSQLPGGIFHAKAIQEGEVLDTGHVVFGGPGARGRLSNPLMRRLGSSNKFTGSSHGYDVDPDRVIAYTLARRLPQAAKAMMIREAVDVGAGVRGLPGQLREHPEGWKEIEGAFKPSSTGAPEGTAKETSLYTHPDAYKELRQVLQVDDPWSSIPGTHTASLLSVVGITEAATHIKNLGTLLFKPGVNLIQFVNNIWGVMKRKPWAEKRLLELSERAQLKPEGLEAGIHEEGVLWGGKSDPTYWASKLQKATFGRVLEVVDQAVRLTLDDAFTNLVNRKGGGVLAGGKDILNTEQNRRDFTLQVGNYQKQTQHAFVAWLRDTGLGRFATAGTAMTAGGVKTVLGRAGVKTETAGAQGKLMAEYYAKLIGTLSLAYLANYMMWGQVSGDDNTPFGAVKVSDGKKTGYIDLLALTGWNRGARTIGLQATIEGNRVAAHATRSQIADRALLHDIPHALIHPAVGPPVQFAWEAKTGTNTIGMPLHEKVKNGNSEFLANLQAALLNANPVVAVTTGSDRMKDDATAMEKGMKILGPFGIHYSKRPPGKPLPPH